MEKSSVSGQGRTFDLFLVLLMVLAISVVVVAAVGADSSPESAAAAGGGAASGGGAEATSESHIALSEYDITGDLVVRPGNVTLEIHNDGVVKHTFVVENAGRTGEIAAGSAEVLQLGAIGEGTYRVICDVPGHEALGMVATLTVSSTATITASSRAATTDGGAAVDEAEASSEGHLMLSEYEIMGDFVVRPGNVILEIHNEGVLDHDLVIEGLDRTSIIPGGGVEILTLGTMGEGMYRIFCDIPGHADLGMDAMLNISATAEPMTGVHDNH